MENQSSNDGLSLDQLIAVARDNRCVRLLFKRLADNDNTKNQVYLGPGFESLNLVPNKGIYDASSAKNAIFKADLDFAWITDEGALDPAPEAKLILYPQYPEVRFSGFLRGSKAAPSELFQPRKDGISQMPPRVLVLAITDTGSVLGYAAETESPLGRALNVTDHPSIGVFFDATHLLSESGDTREQLLQKLREINALEYVDSIRLNPDGSTIDCRSPNCGGYTLEALLGISPNGFSEPDYLGWEVKQHAVASFHKLDKAINAGVITLMTPEPNLGYYKESGVEAFIRKYGYPDKRDRPDRLNFGGIHRANERNASTGLTMRLRGYDRESGKIVEGDGAIDLVSDAGEVAAGWSFAGLFTHWNRKHAQAVYVPSVCRMEPSRQYAYGPKVRLGIGTDFLLCLRAFADGVVYYDPGIKLENISTAPKSKRRSQFRIKSGSLNALYSRFETVDL